MNARVKGQHPYRTCVHKHDCDYSPCPYCPIPSLEKLVRDQIFAEGPYEYYGVYMTHEPTREAYIDDVLNGLSNCELLERISGALEKMRAKS